MAMIRMLGKVPVTRCRMRCEPPCFRPFQAFGYPSGSGRNSPAAIAQSPVAVVGELYFGLPVFEQLFHDQLVHGIVFRSECADARYPNVFGSSPPDGRKASVAIEETDVKSGEGGTLTDLAADGDSAAPQFNELLHNGGPRPVPPNFSGRVARCLGEALKMLSRLFSGMLIPLSRTSEIDRHLVPFRPKAQPNRHVALSVNLMALLTRLFRI